MTSHREWGISFFLLYKVLYPFAVSLCFLPCISKLFYLVLLTHSTIICLIDMIKLYVNHVWFCELDLFYHRWYWVMWSTFCIHKMQCLLLKIIHRMSIILMSYDFLSTFFRPAWECWTSLSNWEWTLVIFSFFFLVSRWWKQSFYFICLFTNKKILLLMPIFFSLFHFLRALSWKQI